MATPLFKERPILLRFGIMIVVIMLGSGIQLYTRYFSHAFDKTEPVIIKSSETSAPTSVSTNVQFSNQGIPSIAAKTREQHYYSLGFLHANDRLWQMELLRRQASGQLSEVFGSTYLSVDQFSVAVDFYSAAKRQLAQMTPSTKMHLQMYVDGVNQWIAAQSTHSFPFKYYNVNPEKWTLEDSLAIFLLDQFRRSNGVLDVLGIWSQHSADVTAQQLFTHATKKTDGLLQRAYDFTDTVSFSRMDLKYRLLNDIYSQTSTDLNVYVSNGNKELVVEKATGLDAMSRWYFVTFTQEDGHIDISGATLPGVPYFLTASSATLDWSVLPSTISGTKLVQQALSAARPDQYLIGQEAHQFETRVYHIAAKRPSPAILYDELPAQPVDIRSTSVGPLISDHIQGLSLPIALRTQLHDSTTSPRIALLSAWMQLPEMTSAQEARNRFAASGDSETRLLLKSYDSAELVVMEQSLQGERKWLLKPIGKNQQVTWRESATTLIQGVEESQIQQQLLNALQSQQPLSASMQALLFAWQQQLKQQFLQRAMPVYMIDTSAYDWLYARGFVWWAAVYQQKAHTCSATGSEKSISPVCKTSANDAFIAAVDFLMSEFSDDSNEWGSWLSDYQTTKSLLRLPFAEFLTPEITAISSDILFAPNSERNSSLYGSTLDRVTEFQWRNSLSNTDKVSELDSQVFLAFPQSERIVDSLFNGPVATPTMHTALPTDQRVH